MANISEYISKIKTAIYGKDVRGSLADGLDAVNKETEAATALSQEIDRRQTSIEKQFDDQIANMTLDDPSSAELVAARTNVNTGKSYDTIGRRLDAEHADVTAQLAQIDQQKASKEEVISLDVKKITKGVGAVEPTDFSQASKEMLTGGNVAVVGRYSVGSINVLNDAITEKKVSFLKENLINVCEVNELNYSWSTNQPTIDFTDTGFIATPTNNMSGIFFKGTTTIGQKYTVGVKGENLTNVRVYKSDKTTEVVRCTLNADGYYTATFTASESTVYLRFWIETTVQVNYAGIFLGDKYLMTYSMSKGITIDKENIKEKSIEESKTTFFDIFSSKNLFNQNDPNYLEGKSIGYLDGLVYDNPDRNLTGFIPVEEGKILVLSYQFNGVSIVPGKDVTMALYDANMVYNGHYSTGDGVYPIQSGDAWVRIGYSKTFVTGENSNLMIELTDDGLATSYEPYYDPYYKIPSSKVDIPSFDSKNIETKFKDMVFSGLGTSLTEGTTTTGVYLNVVKDTLGLKRYKNCGVGGSRVSGGDNTTGNAFWTDSRVNSLDIESDVITIEGGTNDAGKGLTFSESDIRLDNYDTNNFVGAYNVLLSKIYYKYLKLSSGYYSAIDYSGVTQVATPKEIMIVLITPPQRFDDSAKREETQLITEYIKKIGKMWGIPVLDAWGVMQINYFNQSMYFSDTDKLHYNANGGKKLGNSLVGLLRSIEPVA